MLNFFWNIFVDLQNSLFFIFRAFNMRDYGKRTDNINALIFFATFAFSFITCAYWSGLTLLPEQDLNGSSWLTIVLDRNDSFCSVIQFSRN